MKTRIMKATSLATSFVMLLSFTTSCKTASFETTWPNETDTWKTYSLNGVEFKVPSELVPVKDNSNLWTFIIRSEQADNFSEGVREAVTVRCVPRSDLSIEVTKARTIKNIEANGGRTRTTERPVKGLLYFNPDVIKPYNGTKVVLNDSFVTGSSFGYVFDVGENHFVQVGYFKIDHESIPYRNWKPETEIFPEKDRQLIDNIVQLVH